MAEELRCQEPSTPALTARPSAITKREAEIALGAASPDAEVTVRCEASHEAIRVRRGQTDSRREWVVSGRHLAPPPLPRKPRR